MSQFYTLLKSSIQGCTVNLETDLQFRGKLSHASEKAALTIIKHSTAANTEDDITFYFHMKDVHGTVYSIKGKRFDDGFCGYAFAYPNDDTTKSVWKKERKIRCREKEGCGRNEINI